MTLLVLHRWTPYNIEIVVLTFINPASIFSPLSSLHQFVASNNLKDAGAIASARAAELYGLNIIEENMQAMNLSTALIL